jgi:hypothetical protein
LDQILMDRRLTPVPTLGPVRDPAAADQPQQPGHPFPADPHAHAEAKLGVHPRRPVRTP